MYHINYHSNIADLKAHYALLPGLHFETVKAAREFSEREAYKVMHTLHQECPGVLFDRFDTDRSVTIRLGKATCRWDIVEDGTEPTEAPVEKFVIVMDAGGTGVDTLLLVENWDERFPAVLRQTTERWVEYSNAEFEPYVLNALREQGYDFVALDHEATAC